MTIFAEDKNVKRRDEDQLCLDAFQVPSWSVQEVNSFQIVQYVMKYQLRVIS